MRRHNSMMSVLSGLLAVGLVVGLSVGSALAVEPTDNTGAGQSATQALDSLEVKGRAPKTGYKRTQFGKAWADVDRNGCDTRNDILNRDLTDVKHKVRTHDCVVESGQLHDPYTGKDIATHGRRARRNSARRSVPNWRMIRIICWRYRERPTRRSRMAMRPRGCRPTKVSVANMWHVRLA